MSRAATNTILDIIRACAFNRSLLAVAICLMYLLVLHYLKHSHVPHQSNLVKSARSSWFLDLFAGDRSFLQDYLSGPAYHARVSCV